MRWFGLPVALAGLGLPGPALLAFVAVAAVRVARDLGPFELIYLVAFLGLGSLAG